MLTLLAVVLLVFGSMLVGVALYDAECQYCGKPVSDSPARNHKGEPVCEECAADGPRERGWWNDEIAPGGGERGNHDSDND